MQVSNSFWDVCGQYFSENTLLPIFAVALIWIWRKWNREKRSVLITVLCVSVLAIYNELIYRLTGLVGESSTYYRFFWMIPMALFGAYAVVELFYYAKGKQRMMLVGVMLLMAFMFSSKGADTWVNFPENIYQVDDDVVQVADAVMELTGGEPAYLLDNWEISETVREYNAKINITEKYLDNINQILFTDKTNYLGRYVQDYVYMNESDYIAIQKAEVTRWKVIESGGMKRVSETDNYYLYKIEHELFEADTLTIEELERGVCDYANVEYIPIAGLEKTSEFVYISDFGDWTNEEAYKEVIEKIKSLPAEAVFINHKLSQNAEWVVKYRELLEELKIPYYCNDKAIQVIDMADYYVCMLDNCNGVSQAALTEFQTLKAQGKPMVVIVSEALSNEVQDEFFESVTEKEGSVVQVLSAKKDDYKKDLLNNCVLQYATSVDNKNLFNIVRVTGLEK